MLSLVADGVECKNSTANCTCYNLTTYKLLNRSRVAVKLRAGLGSLAALSFCAERSMRKNRIRETLSENPKPIPDRPFHLLAAQWQPN